MQFICMGLLLLCGAMQAQQVTGRVTDAFNDPLPGVSIVVQGTQQGTVTDPNGNYSLSNVQSSSVLVYSFVGFTSKQETVGNRRTINVVLEEETTTLDDVVVIGYTTVRRAELTSSVVTLQSEAITDNVTSDFGSMLQGKVAGLTVTMASGAPGSESRILIRGVGTITANQDPLFVVDGIPGGDYDPNDVESVTVLKDVGTTAIYGADGANGVIVITTKQGRRNQTPRITFRANLATNTNSFGRYKPMNSEELYDHFESLNMPGFETNYPRELRSQNFDWKDAVYKRGYIQDYSVSVSGGTQNTSYMVSVNHFNQKGNIAPSSYQRTNLRLNFNVQLSNTLDMSVRLNMGQNETESALLSNSIAVRAFPWNNPFDADGNAVNLAENPSYRWDYSPRYNPFHTLQHGGYDRMGGFNAGVDLVLNWNILPWLTATNTTRLGRRSSWTKSYYDGRDISDRSSTGRSRVSESISYTPPGYTNTSLLKASHRMGIHSFGAMIGYEASNGWTREGYRLSASSELMPPGMDLISAGSQTYHGITNGYAQPQASWSVLGNLTYSYAEKYLASVSYRSDVNINFHPDHRLGHFPAMSLGWVATGEDFLKNNPIVRFLKLRASYGKTGNARFADAYFQYLASYQISGVPYLGQTGATPSRQSNPDLGWETAYMLSGGIDFQLFRWLEGSVDLYNNLNRDILFSAPLAPSTGYYSTMRNIGEVSNRGVEVQLTTTNINKKDWKWTTSFNIGANRNRVEKLPDGEPIMVGAASSAQQRLEEGKELYSWYMAEWLGVDPDNGKPLWYGNLRDAEGNLTGETGPMSDFRDMIPQYVGGSASPKFTGGLYNQVSYKMFSLSANFYFLYGNKIYNTARNTVDNDGTQLHYNQMSHDNGLGWSRWRKPGDIATHPQPLYGGNNEASASPSTRYLENGGYLRLRNVTLSCNIPRNLLSSVGINGARIFLTGDNLYTWSRFSGPDPETRLSTTSLSVAGTQGTITPPLRNFSFGLEVQF